MSVGTGDSSQSGLTRSRTRSAASSAGEAARAAASAARTSSVTCAWEAALPETVPTCTPWLPRTKETTETSMPCMTPLVVSVLLAQRRLALVESRTITMQSLETVACSPCSTRLCGVTCWLLTGRPPGWC